MDELKVSTAAVALLFILGCSGPNANPPPPPPAPARPTTVFEPLTQQLERAREVQNTVDENTDATRKAVDEQERGDHSP
jgi:hypothetical protein